MRQKVKRDTEINWKKAINFIPKLNEIIIYDCLEGLRFKIGDGVTHVNDLPFTDGDTFNLLDGLLIMKGE